MPGRCLEGVWKESGRCLEGVWTVSWKYYNLPDRDGNLEFFLMVQFPSCTVWLSFQYEESVGGKSLKSTFLI